MRYYSMIILIALCLMGCQKSSEEEQAPIKAVKIKEMTEQSSGQSRTLSGVVKTHDKTELSFRVSGRIEQLLVDMGESVAKDQILAVLNKQDFELNILSAQATLESAKAALKEKEDEYQRFKKLKEQNYVSEADLEKINALWMNAQSQVQISQTRLEDAKLSLERSVLTAPFSGKIARRLVNPYNEIKAGQPIFEIQGQSFLQVEALMPETLINEIKAGETVQVTFPTLKDVQLTGRIAQIGTDVQAGNAFLIKVSLEQTHPQLRTGMTAVLSFDMFASQQPTFKLPLSALDLKHSTDKNQVSVYVFEAVKQVARKRNIQVGDVVENEVEVKYGLEKGEQVIVAGVPFIQDGQRVKRWVPRMEQTDESGT